MTLKKIILNVDSAGALKSWAHIAFDESKWLDLIKSLVRQQTEWDDSEYNHENSSWNSSKNCDDFHSSYSSHPQTPPQSPPQTLLCSPLPPKSNFSFDFEILYPFKTI